MKRKMGRNLQIVEVVLERGRGPDLEDDHVHLALLHLVNCFMILSLFPSCPLVSTRGLEDDLYHGILDPSRVLQLLISRPYGKIWKSEEQVENQS
jgi:hypothetical protein